MNQVIITGRIIPNTEKSNRNYAYHPANGDKQSFLHCLLSTQKEGAQKDENGYYPTFIVPMKAFGPTADQINQYFGENVGIQVFGVLCDDGTYVGSDGLEHKGGIYIKANKIVYGYGGKPKDETTAATSAARTTVSGTRPSTNATQLRKAQNKIAAPF